MIFDGGGCANPKKNIEHMFLVKKKISCRILKKEKKSSSLINLGVAKDFAMMGCGNGTVLVPAFKKDH